MNWYKIAQNNNNSHIEISSDLHGLDSKDDGDIIRIEAYDKIKEIVIGHLNYFVQNNVIHIDMIEVGPDYRRQGVGTLLMKRMMEENPGLKIEPGVMTNNGYQFYNTMKQQKIV